MISPSPIPPGHVAERCTGGDSEHLCLGLKIVAYRDSHGEVSIEQDVAESLVQDVNAIWNACKIAFQLEQFDEVDPTVVGLHYGNEAQSELNRIRREFVDPSTFLVVVTGPWKGKTIAWTTLPGVGPFGTVMAKDAGQNPLSVAHELGHYQGLRNVHDSRNLMSSTLGPLSRDLTQKQCETAREITRSHWLPMLRF